jgi:hypothetical protein
MDMNTTIDFLPELDSMALFELEPHFRITILQREDVTADVFETLARLASFVDNRLR